MVVLCEITIQKSSINQESYNAMSVMFCMAATYVSCKNSCIAKKEKKKKRKKRKNFKAKKTIKRLPPKSKCYCFSHACLKYKHFY